MLFDGVDVLGAVLVAALERRRRRRPCRARSRSAALVGLPSASNAIRVSRAAGIPRTERLGAARRLASTSAIEAARASSRRVTVAVGNAHGSRARRARATRSCSVAACRSKAGISSVPISNARVWVLLDDPMPPLLGRSVDASRTVLHVGRAARLRERADAQDVGHALGGGNNAAGIEQVERVAALEHAVVGRQAAGPPQACAGTPPRGR